MGGRERGREPLSEGGETKERKKKRGIGVKVGGEGEGEDNHRQKRGRRRRKKKKKRKKGRTGSEGKRNIHQIFQRGNALKQRREESSLLS